MYIDINIDIYDIYIYIHTHNNIKHLLLVLYLNIFFVNVADFLYFFLYISKYLLRAMLLTIVVISLFHKNTLFA